MLAAPPDPHTPQFAGMNADLLAERISLTELLARLDLAPQPAHDRSGVVRATCPHCRQPLCFVTASSYRCDGCDARGGAFELVMAARRLSWSDTFAYLTDLSGTPEQVSTLRARRADAQLAHDIAAKWYAAQFAESATARTYWEGRGFSFGLAEREGIGYAPPNGQLFLDAMEAAGVRPRALRDAGLSMVTAGGDSIATFRDRVLFPFRDAEDLHCVAFSGRLLVPKLRRDGSKVSKYWNTPNTVLWSKGATLYGFGSARDAIAEHRQAIVVEGQFHRLRMLEAGLTNTVASCGTALTDAHARLLAQTARGDKPKAAADVIVLFDDKADTRAFAAAETLLPTGIGVRVTLVPPGRDDPDAYGRTAGLPALCQLVADAPDVFSALYRGWTARHGDPLPLLRRTGAFDRLTALVALTDTARIRTEVCSRIAAWLGIPEDAVRAHVKALGAAPSEPGRRA